jgi:hypothetical protein
MKKPTLVQPGTLALPRKSCTTTAFSVVTGGTNDTGIDGDPEERHRVRRRPADGLVHPPAGVDRVGSLVACEDTRAAVVSVR